MSQKILQQKNNWRKVKLGRFLEIVRGISYSSGDLRKTADSIYLVNLKNVERGGGFRTDGLKDYSGKCKDEQFVEEGDIVVAMTDLTPQAEVIGMPALIPKLDKKTCISMDIIKLRPKKGGIDKKFLYYLLNTRGYQGWIRGFASGVNVLHLDSNGIADYEPVIPEDINKQKCIANILSAFDDKIELNNKINKILEEMAQAIFKEWFVSFRFPGHEKVKMVDSEFGKNPEGWKIKTLGEILTLEYGKGLTSINRKKGNIPVYGSSGLVGYHDKKLVNGPGVIVGRAGIPGSVYWSETDFYCVDSTFYVETKISKYFLFYLLKRQNLKSLISGSAVPGINRNIVYTNRIILPSSETINDFEKVVSSIFSKIYRNKLENQKLAALRDLLLPKLMNGDIKV